MITPVAHTVSLPLPTLVAAVASVHNTVCCRIFCDVVDVVNVVDVVGVVDAVNAVTVFVVVVVNVVISVVVDDRCRLDFLHAFWEESSHETKDCLVPRMFTLEVLVRYNYVRRNLPDRYS